MAQQFVYFFGGGKADGSAQMRDLLGGKGAGLAEMTNLGIPVPPGFTLTTEVCTYFYAHDRADGSRVLDAVHIYNVSSIVGGDRESFVEIVWTRDGMKAALFINDSPHADVDFAERRSYCRTGFPSPPRDWDRGAWSDDLIELFRVQ